VICPRCHAEVPDGPECAACGIVVSKYLAREEGKAEAINAPAVAQPAPDTKVASGQAIHGHSERPWPFRPLSDARLAGTYSQLAHMLEAGISLIEALKLVVSHSRGRLRDAFVAVVRAVEAGSSLSSALVSQAPFFSPTVCSLVDAGEQTGDLPAVFRSLSESLQLRLDMRRRVMRACLYPFILFTLSFFLIPLSRLFVDGMAAYLRSSLVPYLIALACLFAVVFLAPWLLGRLLGPAAVQAFTRSLPIVGRLWRLRSKTRFSRHLSTALGAGLELKTAIYLAARTTGEISVIEKTDHIVAQVGQGDTLTAAMEHAGLFDEEFQLAVSAGELSGRLDEALEQQARIGQEAFLHRLQVAVQLAAVVVLLLVYAFVVWSILSEYKNILGGYEQQIDQLVKELGGDGANLDTLLKEMGGPAGSSKLPRS